MAADSSKLDLLIIQIDGIHIKEDLMLLAAVGVDGKGGKHPLGVIEGATENATVAQALLDNLIGRGLDPKVCRLFVIDGGKALPKAIRRLSAATHRSSAARSTRPAISWKRSPMSPRQACARRCGKRGNGRMRQQRHGDAEARTPRGPDAPDVSASIREGLDEILTVTRLGLPARTAKTVRQDQPHREHERYHPPRCRNVKRWNNASMALRWTGTGDQRKQQEVRWLKAKTAPASRAALARPTRSSTNGQQQH